MGKIRNGLAQIKWTQDRIREAANSCSDRAEFCRLYGSAYNRARKLGILDQVCEHMPKRNGFKRLDPTRLYYLRVDVPGMANPLYKLGITNTTVLDRYQPADMQKITRLRFWQFKTGAEALSIEQRIKRHCIDHRYKGRKVLRTGNTELFTSDILGLDLAA